MKNYNSYQEERLHDKLIAAIKDNNIKDIKSLINNIPKKFKSDNEYFTYSIIYSNYDVILLLIENEFELLKVLPYTTFTVSNRDDETQLKLYNYFIKNDYKFNYNISDISDLSQLPPKLFIIIMDKINSELSPNMKQEIFTSAIIYDNINILKILLKNHNININKKDNADKYPIEYTLELTKDDLGKNNIIKLLIDNGADLSIFNKEDKKEDNSIYFDLMKIDDKTIKYMVEYGFDYKYIIQKYINDLEMMKLLVSKKFKINIIVYEDITSLLQYTIKNGSLEVAEFLYKSGAKATAIKSEYESSFIAAGLKISTHTKLFLKMFLDNYNKLDFEDISIINKYPDGLLSEIGIEYPKQIKKIKEIKYKKDFEEIKKLYNIKKTATIPYDGNLLFFAYKKNMDLKIIKYILFNYDIDLTLKNYNDKTILDIISKDKLNEFKKEFPTYYKKYLDDSTINEFNI